MDEEREPAGVGGVRERVQSPRQGVSVDQSGPLGFSVPRDRLVGRVLEQCRTAGILFICAPRGFGKTSLLMQCAATIRNDPEHGIAVLLSGTAVTPDELMGRLDAIAGDLASARSPCILIDDMPHIDPDQAPRMVDALRGLREGGFSIILACTPDKRPFMERLGDSSKMGAQSLRVQPREYTGWARTFSISSALDVYELTQGIPVLVVALQAVTGSRGEGLEHLGRQVADLYTGALADVSGATALGRLLTLLILLGEGSLTDLERCGVRAKPETISVLRRDYPIIQLDDESRGFSCLGGNGLKGLRARIVRDNPSYLQRAVRIHLKANRVDRAIELMSDLMKPAQVLEVLAQFPTSFALAGRGLYVNRVLSSIAAVEGAPIPVGVVLNLYLSALTLGDYRAARSAAMELCRRAAEIEDGVSPADWACALAMRNAWGTCRGIDLPHVGDERAARPSTGPVKLLRQHALAYPRLIGEFADGDALFSEAGELSATGQLDVPALLIGLDAALEESLREGAREVQGDEDTLGALVTELDRRKMAGLSARVRMVWALRRLLAGLPISDERALGDAGTVAVRESDQQTQLLCLVAEGWQFLALGQVVNAQFRGQQVRRLASDEHPLLIAWAGLLEEAATLLNSSLVSVREEAELLDLALEPADPSEAWRVALRLSAARYDSDLSVWFSLHKPLLLDIAFRPFARLAMRALGDRAASARRLIPTDLRDDYRLGPPDIKRDQPLFGTMPLPGIVDVGQVNVNLFGGFHVDRNGHVLTSDLWRRKKAGVLAARLALSIGSFVGRSLLIEEMWPESELTRGRQNLYTATSTLKNAFRQKEGGPQYVIAQAEGLALNGEYVSSDTLRFDMLAREVLLQRVGTSGRQIVENCLKLEELYHGPLFVPDSGATSFFLGCRRSFGTKYVDCLVRGVDAALEDDDLSSASWLVEALLKQAPTREDVLRRAMKVFGLCGRRREVAELYGSHLFYLRNELRAEPEPETRRTYEAVLAQAGGVPMI